MWEDYRLEWDPNVFEGLKSLYIPVEDVWFPIFVLYNKQVDCY